jgi:hypothetical protein
MLLRTPLRRGLPGILLALEACGDFTLVEPQPPEPEPTALSVSLSAISDESTRYDLDAVFRPGTDASGEPTRVVDPALRVEGTPVLPDQEAEPGLWFYQWEHSRATTGDGVDSVRVTFPVVANSSPATYSIAIPVPGRAGPADLGLIRGEDLLLRVTPAPDRPPGLSGRGDFWMLEIRQSCSVADSGPQVMITARGPYPSELRVPWQWLQALAAGPMSACFHAASSFEAVGSPYPASVGVVVRLAWRIQVVEPAM